MRLRNIFRLIHEMNKLFRCLNDVTNKGGGEVEEPFKNT